VNTTKYVLRLFIFSIAFALSACGFQSFGSTDRVETNPSLPMGSVTTLPSVNEPESALTSEAGVDLSVWNESSVAALSSDKTMLAALGPGGIYVYDLENLQKVALITVELSVLDIAFSPENKTITIANRDALENTYGLQIIEIATGIEINNSMVFDRGDEYAYGMEYLASISSDGKVLALYDSQPYPGLIRLWDATTGKEMNSLSINIALSLEFSPDNSRLAVGDSYEDGVTIWDYSSGNKIQTINVLKDHTGVYSLRSAFSPDSQLFAVAAGYDEALFNKFTVTIFDYAGSQELISFDVPVTPGMGGNPLFTMAFSNDGTMLATGSAAQITIWDSNNGHQLGSIDYSVENNSYAKYDLLFTRDDTRLISSSDWNEQVIMWDVLTGGQLAP
jgi:WD40 repeat protein